MKTNFKSQKVNKVQKAISKSILVVVSLFLFCAAVQAQDLWKTLSGNNNYNETALAMAGNNLKADPASTNANAFAAYLIPEIEATLDLEEWMIHENCFASFIFVEEINENSLELENWMVDGNWFDANSMYLMVETEAALEVENWMINESNFYNPVFQIIEETDYELELENWMLNENLFNTIEEIEQPLELESWMISEKTWVI